MHSRLQPHLLYVKNFTRANCTLLISFLFQKVVFLDIISEFASDLFRSETEVFGFVIVHNRRLLLLLQLRSLLRIPAEVVIQVLLISFSESNIGLAEIAYIRENHRRQNRRNTFS